MAEVNCRKVWPAGLAAFVVYNVLEFVLHGVLLKDVYARPHYQHLWNGPDVMKARMPAMWLAYLVFGQLFARIYAQGYEDGKPPIGQGLRFGSLVGIMIGTYHSLINYAVYPVSCKLAGAWLAGSILHITIVGAVVAAVYKPKTA